tara:strand:+ start:983 stop:2521 length:1539 start_codon:yes stop_codon:yes gene_type:complete
MNFLPKYSHASLIPKSVKTIINSTLKHPPIIPNILDGKYNYDISKNQYSPYKKGKICSTYSLVDLNKLNVAMNDFSNKQMKFNRDFTFQMRIDIFNKAAELLTTKYRDKMLAYTIISQNKTLYEAEIDAVCELHDFLKYNIHYYEKLISKQPISVDGYKNISEYNPLNGFIASITPFNFTAIGGNLASLPMLMGNSVFWKPADNAILSNYLFYEILLESNMPEYIMNFVPSDGELFSQTATMNKNLGGLLFTGSTEVFESINEKCFKNYRNYRNYPRVIGETGGKNYHFIDTNIEDINEVVKMTIESAYNYSGQKCSSCSRVYVPRSLEREFKSSYMEHIIQYIKTQETYGVINQVNYDRLKNVIGLLNDDEEVKLIYGGHFDDNMDTYYISPSLYECNDTGHYIYNKEFFGPILAMYVYEDDKIGNAINMCINNDFALTGSVFSSNQEFIDKFRLLSLHSCGNFYVNDKSTGSVVGQQPFGGFGKSGTNDKAGDINMLYRLCNQKNSKIKL